MDSRSTLPKLIHSILFGILLFIGSLGFADEAARRPNTVILMTDDQRWDCFGGYGRSEFETLHIDLLADNGVIHDNAYDAVTICMPSRVTMMTRSYLSNHRVGITASCERTLSQNDFASSYPVLLKQASYRTGFIGKLAFGPRVQQGNFRAAFTTAEGWGRFSQTIEGGRQNNAIELRYGTLSLKELTLDTGLEFEATKAEITVNGDRIEARWKLQAERAVIEFPSVLDLSAGQIMVVEMS